MMPSDPAGLFVPAWAYPAICGLLFAALALQGQPPAPVATPPAAQDDGTRTVYLPLMGQSPAIEQLAADELTGTIAYRPRFGGSTLRIPLIASLPAQAPAATQGAPAPERAGVGVSAATSAPAAAQASDESTCRVFPNVRITWYELGSCCGKAPGHPQYGITRSGLPVEWGMAAVQAQVPLVPLGTRIIVRDIGAEYRFIVTDTGSETAFGSSWVDIYAPTIRVGHWVERQVGGDGRSDVLVCP